MTTGLSACEIFYTAVPLDPERIRKAGPVLLMALIELYGLELADDDFKRGSAYRQRMIEALGMAQMAIEQATGMEAV